MLSYYGFHHHMRNEQQQQQQHIIGSFSHSENFEVFHSDFGYISDLVWIDKKIYNKKHCLGAHRRFWNISIHLPYFCLLQKIINYKFELSQAYFRFQTSWKYIFSSSECWICQFSFCKRNWTWNIYPSSFAYGL